MELPISMSSRMGGGGALTGVCYGDEFLDVYVRPFSGAVGDNFVSMDDDARPHRARVVDDYLEDEGIECLDAITLT